MPSFPFDPAGYTAGGGWRPLRLKTGTPYQRGWDVYDLQCKLAATGDTLTTDGVFGPETSGVTKQFQAAHGLVVDGIAGVSTQTTLGAWVCGLGELPARIRGQVEKESSLLCGIYTAPYPDGTRDRGPVQENSGFWTSDTDAFDCRRCLPALVSEIKAQHARYVSQGVEDTRAWAAAQGYWNNHVYANRYARGETVPQTFLDYVAAVTAYV